MDIIQFMSNLSTKERTISFLRQQGILPTEIICSCEKRMREKKSKRTRDGYVFRCKTCGDASVRKGCSILKRMRISLEEFCVILYSFSCDIPMYIVEKFLPRISHKTITKMYKKLRNIMQWKMAKIESKKKLKGTVDLKVEKYTKHNIIEIDESAFGKKQKYTRGRKTKKRWVFGLVERNTNKVILEPVNRRTKAVLHPLIEKHVSQGAKIYHDDWPAYRKLHNLGYLHGIVNHTKEFVSSDGVCTNTIEGIWGLIKQKIAYKHGLEEKQLYSHLKEFSYRYRYKNNVLRQLIRDIKKKSTQ